MLNEKCEFCNNIHDNWDEIIQCYEQNKNKVNWEYISINQQLSEEFIEKFSDKVAWDWISRYQKLSKEFIERFKDKLDLNVIRERKENWISIYEYANKYNLEIDDEYLYAY